MRLITDARASGGPFTGLFDFAARVDLRRVGKRALEMLARSGALDALDSNRRKVFESLEALMAFSASAHEERASAQVSLFGDATTALPAPRLPSPEDWSPVERLTQEHQAVGFYLSGHPLDDYARALRRERVLTYAELVAQAGTTGAAIARIAGTIAAVDLRKSAKGFRFAFVRLSDPTGMYEVSVFSELFESARDQLVVGASVVLTVEAATESDEMRLRTKAIQPIDLAVADAASAGFKVYINAPEAAGPLANRLAAVAREGAAVRRRGPISLLLLHPELPGEVEIALPEPYPMTPQILGALKTLPGVVHVEEF
jgi:DNA polymerase-3 subunit alpha